MRSFALLAVTLTTFGVFLWIHATLCHLIWRSDLPSGRKWIAVTQIGVGWVAYPLAPRRTFLWGFALLSYAVSRVLL